MTKVIKKIDFSSSIYTAAKDKNYLYVGGSDWDRRKILYTKEIAEKSKGILYILEKRKEEFVVKRKIIFPSMVYCIIKLFDNRFFVGCKSEKSTFNIIDGDGRIIKKRDDKGGKGVYNAVFNEKENEVIVSTRTGKVEIIDINTLKIKKRIQLTDSKTRVWSVFLDVKSNLIYAGDYEGNLYVIDRNNSSKNKIKKICFKKYYEGKLKKNFGPSIWGLLMIKGRFIIGTRWNYVFELDKKFNLIKRFNFKEDISCIEYLSKETILIGSRYGKLFELNLKTKKIKKLIEIKPTLQKENAIWGMNRVNSGVLVCFADGCVCYVR